MEKPKKTKECVAIYADVPGWTDVYLYNLPYLPRKGEGLDLSDVDYPEHQNILRSFRSDRFCRYDWIVKSVFHIISKGEQIVVVEIHPVKKSSIV
mgnify:FL=1